MSICKRVVVIGLSAIYYALIHCHLVYANIIWSSTKESFYKCIFLKQKSAIMIISSAPYNAHTEPLFKQLNVLPLPKLCLFFKLQFFHLFKGIVSRDFEWLQTILMNRLCVPDVPLEVYSFLNSHLHTVF